MALEGGSFTLIDTDTSRVEGESRPVRIRGSKIRTCVTRGVYWGRARMDNCARTIARNERRGKSSWRAGSVCAPGTLSLSKNRSSFVQHLASRALPVGPQIGESQLRELAKPR